MRWPESTEGWREDRLWALDAVRHWMLSVAHGFEGRRMRTGELARWCELKSAGTLTTWIGKGGVWGASGLRYCEEARSRTDCSPECDSGHGDLAELRRRYAGALRGSDEQRKAAQLQSLRLTKIPTGYVLTPKEVDRRLPALVQAQDGALRSLDAVTVNDSESGVDRLTLAEVRVERGAEAQVLKHIRRRLAGAAQGQAAALVGEPGVGKSCSLRGSAPSTGRTERHLPGSAVRDLTPRRRGSSGGPPYARTARTAGGVPQADRTGHHRHAPDRPAPRQRPTCCSTGPRP
ncbi:hypothetical protein OHB11_01800 [Streptomyces zaomyceticus]|uniref:hypothetical protein n=1 Tax=Streptomyces zaomyceticus TaxID=68286 RepID=UPI00324CB607